MFEGVSVFSLHISFKEICNHSKLTWSSKVLIHTFLKGSPTGQKHESDVPALLKEQKRILTVCKICKQHKKDVDSKKSKLKIIALNCSFFASFS